MMGNEINILRQALLNSDDDDSSASGDSWFDIYYLSDLDYGSRKYIIEGLKNQPYETNYINLKYRMKLTDEEINDILSSGNEVSNKEKRSIPDPFILDVITYIRNKTRSELDNAVANEVSEADSNEVSKIKEFLKDKDMYKNYMKVRLSEDLKDLISDNETIKNYYTKIGIKEKDINKILLNVKISKLKRPTSNITITPPPGAYNIVDIKSYIQSYLKQNNSSFVKFRLAPDVNTLCSQIESFNSITFTSDLNH